MFSHNLIVNFSISIISMNAIIAPITKYGLSFGLFESASKKRIIPIAELGPDGASEEFLMNLTINPPFLYMNNY